MERKRTDRIQSLNDIVDTINQMTGDDEILTKVALKFISSLRASLETGGPFDIFFDSSNIPTNFWPYGPPPDLTSQAIEEKNNINIENEIHHTATRRTITDDTAPILHRMQQEMGMKMRQQDLIGIGKLISANLEIPLKKKERQSKVGILEWMQSNWDIIEPSISDNIRQYKNSISKDES